MSDLGITWLLNLINGVSGPAKAAEGDLHHLEQTFKQVHEISKLVEGGFLKAGMAAGATGAALNLLGSGLETVAEVGLEAVKAVAEIGKSFAEAAVHAASFEENTRNSLHILMGDTLGEKALQDAKRLADMTQLRTEQVMEGSVAFSVAKVSPEEINKLNIAMADVAGINSQNPMATRDFSRHITEILTNGGHLLSLTALQRELHLPKTEMLKNIAQAFNIRPEDVEKNFKNLEGKGVVAAILKTIAGMQGGNLGTLTEKASKTVSGLFSTLASRPEAQLGGLSLERGYLTFRNFLQGLVDLTNPLGTFGKKIQTGLYAIFNGAFRSLFGDFEGAEGLQKMQNILQNLLTAFSYIGAASAGMFAGLEGVLEGLLGTSDDLFGGPLSEEQIKAVADTMKDFGKSVGEAIRDLIPIFEGLGAGVKSVYDTMTTLSNFAAHPFSMNTAGVSSTPALSAAGAMTGTVNVHNDLGGIHVDASGKDPNHVGALVGEHVNDALLKFLEQKGTTTGGVRAGVR